MASSGNGNSPCPEYTLLTPMSFHSDMLSALEDTNDISIEDLRQFTMFDLMSSSNNDTPPPLIRCEANIDSGNVQDVQREQHQLKPINSNVPKKCDPFSPSCKIPLPSSYSAYDYWLEPSFIRRRNERERQRVRNVNDGFERLRNHLPLPDKERDRRLSKVEILRMAINYIRYMEDMLTETGENQVPVMVDSLQNNAY
ncbi:achaete-scute homolog 1-like isoform X1 [Tachypleus tridentatus]|uniref:achaete-scute homolog 1-like isoform X1 n=1 Tax=Tachypleus tridentatus TaxID=6853 RepID=UPI003FD2C2C7